MRSVKKTSLLAALIVAGLQQVSAAEDTRGVTQVTAAGSQSAAVVPMLPPPQSPHRSPLDSPATVPATSHPTAPSPGCFFLNARSFTIPFTVDAAGAQPTEVQLFTSRGPTSPWQKIDGKPATDAVKEFQFTGPEDGEFWFATRTIDAGGRAHPSGPIEPQLKVFVDTHRPQVVLDAEADASGRVDVVVRIDDSTPLSIQMRYVTDAEGVWQTVDTRRQPLGAKVSFSPRKSWEQLSLQVIATDASKNQSVVSKLINRPRLAETSRTRFAATPSGGAVDASTAQFRADNNRVQTRTVADPQGGIGYAPGSLGNVTTPLGGYRGATLPPRQALPAAAGSPAFPQASTQAPRPFGPPSLYRAPYQSQTLTQNTLPPPATPDQISNGFGLNSPLQSDSKPETQSAPPVAESRPRTAAEAMRPLAPDAPNQGGAANNTIETLPPPEPEVDSRAARQTVRKSIDVETVAGRAPIRFSNSMRFSLDYELEAIGNAGVEAIELYGSTDGGKTWKFWGEDPDRVSPFDIKTKEAGLFGFRIVVVGRNGLASPRPLPGESPDIVVVVDETKPTVRISAAKYGEGDRIGSLVIQYECDDENLRQRPIALAFSDSVDGPWTTIVAGLRNDGSYIWPADPGLPRQLYLRIDATDQAGNVGTYILDTPIDVQGLAPRARIRGFQSLSGAPPTLPGQQTATRPKASFK